MLETVICTISDEGTKTKNELVEHTMRQLSRMTSSKFRVVGVHMGQDPDIGRMVSSYCPEIQLLPFPKGNPLQRMKRGMNSLFTEAKRMVRDISTDEPKSIVYMEGDKNTFVSHIPEVVHPILEDSADVVIPVRSKKGFLKYPFSQVFWETIANEKVSKVTESHLDRMYGPRAWNLACSRFFADCQLNDFSALTYSVVRAQLEGNRVIGVEVPGDPQYNYMRKYPILVRLPGLHFLYRAAQNKPHKYAAELAKLDSKK